MGLKPRKGMTATKMLRVLERRWSELDASLWKWRQLGDEESVGKCKAMRQLVEDIIKEVAE